MGTAPVLRIVRPYGPEHATDEFGPDNSEQYEDAIGLRAYRQVIGCDLGSDLYKMEQGRIIVRYCTRHF